MTINLCRRVLCLAIVLAAPFLSHAAEPAAGKDGDKNDAKGMAFFEAKIRPVLAERCYKCHSEKAGASKGSLLLDSRDSIRAGGDRGPAVVPGDPDASVLLAAITHAESDLEMPPNQPRLPDSIIDDFRTWIRSGAPDPRVEQTAAQNQYAVDLVEGRKFWAFQKPARREIPTTSNPSWARRELDHFILAALDAAGLAHSEDASPAVLLRRLHFDLVGLPPSPSAVADFQARVASGGIDAALAHEVDLLLASDQFGQRWGRHWLDVARFAESSGKETNVSFPHAWRYRDYVIDSLNDDTPYDRFLVEQIAGDLLPYENDAQRAEQLIATGFLALGPKGLNEMNFFQFLADVADEQIDTVTQAVMASTVACARCHDHKFDPFTMEDYYALAGVFVSTKTNYGTSVAPGNQVGGDLVRLPDLDGQLIPNHSIPAQRVAQLNADLAALKKREVEGRAAVEKALENGQDPFEVFSLAEILGIIWRKGAIEGQLKTVDDSGRALPLAMGVEDRAEPIDAPLLARGEISKPGKRVPRGFPQVIDLPDAPPVDPSQSGRLQLAQWLTHPDHPLTARVMANRVWRHLFGEGIVRTVDNFGANGERPSHPELLDHLALRFVDGGWSVKSLVREIVLSRAYRQASTFRQPAFEQDPDNRLLWRHGKRRLDAEAIRDAMLFVSGRLDANRPAGSLVATIGDRPISLIAFDQRVPADLDGSQHRSVYLPVLRDRLPDVLDLFDFAEPSLVTGNRETTNTPLQALYLMNSPFVQEQAGALAERVAREAESSGEQTRLAFLHCFSRAPNDDELRLAAEFLASAAANADGRIDRRQALTNYCHALMATAEFRNLD